MALPIKNLRKPPPLLLRRYTDLPAAIHLLREHHMTLLSPSTWDDRNDRKVMQAYVRRAKVGSAVALCFTDRAETYHHWKVFAPGSQGAAGVCISFKKSSILSLARREKMLYGMVNYKSLNAIKESDFKTDEVPFLKRLAFKDEKEFRLVCPCDGEGVISRSFKLPPDAIQSITINPWMPRVVATSVADTLLELRGERDYKVDQSTLIENEHWTEFASRDA